jgi:leucyl aminopeptidase
MTQIQGENVDRQPTDRLPSLNLVPEAPTSVATADAVAVPVLSGDPTPLLGPGSDALIDRYGIDVFDLLDQNAAVGRPGEVTEHLAPVDGSTRRLLFVGVGASTSADLRRAGAALARRAKGCSELATSVAAVADDEGVAAFVEGMLLGSYRFQDRSTPTGPFPPERVRLCLLGGRARPVVERARRVAEASLWARTMSTVPSNSKSPAWIAEQARALGQRDGLEVTVWDERRLRADGFNAILAVGQESATPPRLVRLDYIPRRVTRRTRHVVLVGKGITFDSGGLSLKPAEAMFSMKRDMTGAAVVLAVMSGLSAVGCPLRVTGLLASAENSIGGDAMRPGDVIRHYGGRTTEVTNTDAEGRLVLADSLAYAVETLAPDALVDVATLTGAVKVSLGVRTGGLFSNHDALADAFLAGASASGEPFWRLPLVDEYVEGLHSEVADSDNAGPGPGAILAALFLRQFTGGLPWLHLDIASVGDSAVDAFEWTPGPTGFGVRALLRWLGGADPLAGV